jgi:hypothetical protein
MYVCHWADFHKTGAWSTTFSTEFFIPNFTHIQLIVQLLLSGQWTDGQTWSLCKVFILGLSAQLWKQLLA